MKQLPLPDDEAAIFVARVDEDCVPQQDAPTEPLERMTPANATSSSGIEIKAKTDKRPRSPRTTCQALRGRELPADEGLRTPYTTIPAAVPHSVTNRQA